MEKINIDMQVSKMDFGSYSDTVKIHDVMKEYGVKNISILCRCSEQMIAKMGSFASPTVKAIKRVLATYGLQLNMTTEQLQAYRNLPEDAFRDKEVTENDLENVRTELYTTLAEKERIEKEIEKLKAEKQEVEDAIWTNRVRYPDLYEDLENTKTFLGLIADRFEQYVNKIGGVVDAMPEQLTPQEELPPITDAEEAARKMKEALENITPPEEDADYISAVIPEDPEYDFDNFVDILSHFNLLHLLDDSASSVMRYEYKEKVNRGYISNAANLYDLCKMKEEEVKRLFQQTNGLQDIVENALKKHSLRYGMLTEELDAYQSIYERFHPKNAETDKQKMTAHREEVNQALDFDPVAVMAPNDLIFLRFRMVEKAMLGQPWWVKMFCKESERLQKALDTGESLYQMELDSLRDESMVHFRKHLNDPLSK